MHDAQLVAQGAPLSVSLTWIELWSCTEFLHETVVLDHLTL
jgi:hypothetical protein